MLESLEAEYSTLLVSALKHCAAGQWELFGQNDAAVASLGKYAKARLSSQDASQLLDLREWIDHMRRKLGYDDPFPLHAHLLEVRSTRNANSLGEPKLAQAWLGELSRNS